MQNLLIREARVEDAEGIVGILTPIIETGLYTVLDTPFTVEAERDFIRTFPERGIFLVAVRESDQRIFGFQNMEPFASYTHAFDHVGVVGTYVDLEARRQGISKRLFEAMFAAAVHKQYEKIFTFIRADNSAALSTYLRHGFRIIGTAAKQAKINGRYVDEILVEKFLE